MRQSFADGDYYIIADNNDYVITGTIDVSKGLIISHVDIKKDKPINIFVDVKEIKRILDINWWAKWKLGSIASSDYRLVFKEKGDVIKTLFEVLR